MKDKFEINRNSNYVGFEIEGFYCIYIYSPCEMMLTFFLQKKKSIFKEND